MAKIALEKIDAAKRKRIFRNAAAEFATHGYHKANINSIARGAGIGKGSIYLYFEDKLDLYHSTFQEAASILNEIFDALENADMEAIEKIEKVFETSVDAFPRYRSMFKMYSDLTSFGNEKGLTDLANVLESRSAEFWRNTLRDGIRAGSIRKDVSVEHAAYLIDCVYTLFVTTLASNYQRERFRVFTGANLSKSNGLVKRHMRKILDVLESGICAQETKSNSRKKVSVKTKK